MHIKRIKCGRVPVVNMKFDEGEYREECEKFVINLKIG